MMSSIPPKPEARRRPVSVLALKLWEIAEQLDERLDNPNEVLEMLVTLLAKGEQTAEVWSKLHAAAARFDKTSDLAFSYEQVTQEKRIKLLSPEQQAFIFLQAAHFFAEIFHDHDGAVAYAERAIAVVPGHPEAFALLEALLTASGKLERLAELFATAAERESDPQKSLDFLYRALRVAVTLDVPTDFVINLGYRILRIYPGDGAVRDEVMRRLLASGRHQDVVDLLEQALKREPPPPAEEAVLHREQLIDLCFSVLQNPERTLTHVEGLLEIDPSHAVARQVATDLLANPQLMLRAAAALSDASEKLGDRERALEMLELELQHVRGPRRVDVQRRLAILRQDVRGDREGALELLGPVVAGDPGDDELRQRFVMLNLELNQPEQAARLLSRALGTHKDPAVHARVGLDIGAVYLATGDVKRAEAAFQKVMEADADERATLAAAKHLADLYTANGDTAQLARALEVVVMREPEREARQVAARKLSQLADESGPVPDPARAVLAYRALIGSPWTEEALDRLEILFRGAGDDIGLSDVVAARAQRAEDPEEARSLAAQALELRMAATTDPAAKVEACRSFSQTFGESREVNARLVPLLEQLGRFEELVEVLLSDIELAPPEEQVGAWFRVAQLRLEKLQDANAALDALSWAVALDAEHGPSREVLEALLREPSTRLRAASILEPLYRRQKERAGLFRVLEARAGAEEAVEARLSAAEEAVALAAEGEGTAELVFEIAGRALVDAVHAAPERVGAWLQKLQELGAAHDPAALAARLAAALGDRAVESRALFEVARALGDVQARLGDPSAAIQTYRRALAFEPGSRELVDAIDGLLSQQGTPSERLALYETALTEERDPARRRDFFRLMAKLLRFELGDRTAAVNTLRRALEEDPGDLDAHEALCDALEAGGDHAGVASEIERVLPNLTGDRRAGALARLAAARERAGDPAAALAHYRELLASAEPTPEILAEIARLALAENDGHTLVTVLERQLASTQDGSRRSELFEQLGDAHGAQLGNPQAAVRYWLEAARLAGAVPDEARAVRLCERVLEAEPQNLEAAERLVQLAAERGDFARLAEVFGVLLAAAGEDALTTTLVALEQPAVTHGAHEPFAALIERALERGVSAANARRLKLVRARVLTGAPDGAAAARATFRELLASPAEDEADVLEAYSELVRRSEPSPERTEDFRFLYDFQVSRAPDPIPILFAWANAEERELGDPRAAIALYERVVTLDRNQFEAYFELARLRAENGDEAGALEALGVLRERASPEDRRVAELATAEILLERMGRGDEALDRLAPILEANPTERDALRIVQRALLSPATSGRAAEMLERVAAASGDPARRADVLEVLLSVSADVPELAEARRAWTSQLLSIHADDPEAAMALALRAAIAAPSERELWQFAEQAARKLSKPEPVAEAYASVFGGALPPELADELGRAMVEFYEEWFDDPERVVQLLERVLALSPDASWAFDRLKLAFNAAGRWEDLFRLYDARLAAAPSGSVRIELLREASMAARDFADDPERAMAYLEALNRESPGDARVEASLERLYERHARKRPLIALLSARLAALGEPEQADTKARIAALWLDLGEAEPALDLAEDLFADERHVAGAVELLERAVALPASSVVPEGADKSPLLRATGKLREHYAATGQMADVVRLLQIEERAASSVAERRALLEQIVRLRLKELRDVPGAFETMAELVLLDPENASYRKHLADLGKRIGAEERRAEVLVTAASGKVRVSVRTGLINEAASVYRHALGNEARAIELYREVLRESDVPAPVELTAARELASLLRAAGDPLERTNVLERLAELEDDATLRRAALGEAAELAFERLGDPARAIRAYRKRLADDATDLEAMNGLCRALEASQAWDELVQALEARASIQEPAAAKADRVRIARIYAEVHGDRATAIQAWRRVVELHGGDDESFQALSALLTAEERWVELGELIQQEVEVAREPERKRQLLLELGALHEERTSDWMGALEAFVAAGDWQAAVRVVTSAGTEGATARQVSARLLELAVAAWEAEQGGPESPPALAADFALDDLCRKLLADGAYADVVERLLAGSRLPLPVRRRRELVREAACLCSDRLGDADRAITLFQSLLEEDGADEIAISCVTRLALLLEEQGRFDVIATLWENQAIARALAGDTAAAQSLWARAGEVSEQRLGDVDRALSAYERGAELGGEVCLEALARVFLGQNRMDQVARALERLCAVSSPEALAERALRLADAYVALNKRSRAREAIEQALPRVSDGASLRQRLAVLYREAEDYAALAALFEDEASRAPTPAAALALLKEAADLHIEKRKQPGPAVPLLQRAIALDPDDAGLRLRLAQALHDGGRFDDAAEVLREQLARYGARRPKDRALVHYELARVLLAAGGRAGALEALDAAARIDPAHPKILHMLARTALDEGDLERAERQYRALLLVAPKDDDADAPSKSEALVALGEIARTRGDEVRYEEFIASAFEAAQESRREARTLEHALRGRARPELVARALELRLAQGVPAREAARCLADLCELHDRELGDMAAMRPNLLGRARVLEDELVRRDSTDDEAWASLGRAYGSLGDASAEARVLERRVDASARSSRPPPGPDLFFRLAQVRLADPKTCEQGLDLLERALHFGLEIDRARALLRSIFPEGKEPVRVLDLFEKSARAEGDRQTLLRVLARRVALGDAGMAQVREGVALAEELGEPALADQLLQAAIEAMAGGASPSDAAWLRLELAKRHRRAGDVVAALGLEEQAAEFLAPAEAKSLLLRIAEEALALGDQGRAARLYSLLRREEPESPAVFGPLLTIYRNTGQVGNLVDLIEETAPLLTDRAERTRLRLEQAELLLNPLGRKEEALLLLRQIVREDPSERAAHARLFELLDAEGREDELIELFDVEIEMLRGQGAHEAASALSLRLAGWLERHGRVQDAVAACRAALEHDPGRRDLLEALLRLAEASGDAEGVGEAIERLLQAERGPSAAALCRRLLAIREQAGDLPGRERALELGFAAAPADPELCEQLAELYRDRGDWARVAGIYERALTERPDDTALLERQIDAYRAAGRHDKALGALERLSERRPEDGFVSRTRAALLSDLGRHAEAVQELERAAVTDPTLSVELVAALERALDQVSPEEKVSLGSKLVDALERAGDFSGARARLLELVDASPEDPKLLARLAALESRSGNDAAALATYARLLEQVDGASLVSVALAYAELCERAGHPARARSALERALAVDRSNANVRARLSAVLEADGAYRALAELLREEAESEPRRDERARKLLRVGELLLLPDGDLDEAVAVLESVRAELKDSIDAVVLLGRAYTYAGQFDRALALLDGCIEAHRGKRARSLGAVYEQKADVHLEEGFLSDALAALGKAFEMDPKNARLGMRYASLAIESDELDIAQRALRAVAIMKTAPLDGPEGARSETKAEANFLLAEIAHRAGDPRKARVLAAKALSDNPDHERARALLKSLDGR